MRLLGAFVALSLVVVGSSCGESEPTADELPTVVEGVIINVESEGLGSVTAFTVKQGDESWEVKIDPDRDYGFNLDHLHEHRTTGDPVRVDLETREGELFAITIDDV